MVILERQKHFVKVLEHQLATLRRKSRESSAVNKCVVKDSSSSASRSRPRTDSRSSTTEISNVDTAPAMTSMDNRLLLAQLVEPDYRIQVGEVKRGIHSHNRKGGREGGKGREGGREGREGGSE